MDHIGRREREGVPLMRQVQDRVCELAADIFAVPVTELTGASTPNAVESWDSLALLNLVTALEDEYEIRIDPEDLAKVTDLASIAALVSRISGTGPV